VASFVGTLNILSGHVVDPASGKMAVDGQELVTTQRLAPDDAGKKRLLALRPEAIVLEAPSAGRNTLAATVEEVNFPRRGGADQGTREGCGDFARHLQRSESPFARTGPAGCLWAFRTRTCWCWKRGRLRVLAVCFEQKAASLRT
jgi:hypothetical protein